MRECMRVRESAENYLKTILALQKRLGEVRSIDVANELNVSKPSVSNAVKKLRAEGLVDMNENRSLFLTSTGYEYAISVFERHVVIEKILTEVLGIDGSVKKISHKSCGQCHIYVSERDAMASGFVTRLICVQLTR